MRNFAKKVVKKQDFINYEIEEICCHEKLSAQEVICFSVYVFLLAFFSIKIVSWYEYKESLRVRKSWHSKYFCWNVSRLRIKTCFLYWNIYLRILWAVFTQ